MANRTMLHQQSFANNMWLYRDWHLIAGSLLALLCYCPFLLLLLMASDYIYVCLSPRTSRLIWHSFEQRV